MKAKTITGHPLYFAICKRSARQHQRSSSGDEGRDKEALNCMTKMGERSSSRGKRRERVRKRR